MMSPLFQFDSVSGGYGGGTVVHEVSASVGVGEALFILGRNGVGKSTLLKLLFGYLPLKKGNIQFKGHNIEDKKPADLHGLGISFCPQERSVFDNLSVLENLSLMRQRRDVSDLKIYFERFPILNERLTQSAGTLSGGERKILSFIRALSGNTDLMLIDEPTEGVQRENVSHFAKLISDRKKSGGTFIIVEQNLDLCDAVADHVLILDQGRTMLSDRREAVSHKNILHYLGV